MRFGLWLPLALGLAACGPRPSLVVTLSDATFATTGGNLFNCTAPAFPPDKWTPSNGPIDCTPGSTTTESSPVIVSQQVACGDGHGALVVVSCFADGAGALAGSVELSITSSCGDHTSNAGNVQSFSFSGVTGSGTQTHSLQACDTFTNFCPSGNACGFNQFGATLDLARGN